MTEASASPQLLGRYRVYDRIAAGGMGTVHYGRLVGAGGFSRTVAIKRLHAMLAADPQFVAMFMEEARLAGRIRHPNVVSVLDVDSSVGELFLVMDYVHGETLGRLLAAAGARGEKVPPAIAVAILGDVLRGLHAAHETKDEHAKGLGIVHRDVSPQNVLVGTDGVARVVDFGVARAAGRAVITKDGELKGKLPYMAPEQLRGVAPDRRGDIWSVAVVLWETLTGSRLFKGENDVSTFGMVLEHVIESPTTIVRTVPAGLGEVVLRGLSRTPDERYATAAEMEIALEAAVARAPAAQVSAWVEAIAGDRLTEKSKVLLAIETGSVASGAERVSAPPPAPKQESDLASGSQFSTSSPASRTRDPGRAKTVLWTALGLVVLVGVAGVARYFTSSPEGPPAEGVAATTRPAQAAAALVGAPSGATGGASSGATGGVASGASSGGLPPAGEPAPPAQPAAMAAISASAPVMPAGAKRPGHPQMATGSGAKGKPSNCYTLDAAGYVHIKPECLK